MSLPGKSHSDSFIVFGVIVLIKLAQIVTANINYNAIRHDEPFGLDPQQARTTRQMLEAFDNWAIIRPNYTLQQATEHLLQYGALLRIQILDTFGSLVYDHYDDYSIRQTEALYRVYQETLERKYNIFDIVPSVLNSPDTRPTRICRYINKNVNTCLKESSMTCLTIKHHDNPHPDTMLSPVVNITRGMYKNAAIRRSYPGGFSLPAVLRHLKAGRLELTVDLLSGLLHNVQYDSFDDEVRTAERNAMIALKSGRLRNLVPKDVVNRVHTVSELLKELFDVWKTTHDRDTNKSFAVLSEHVVREVEAISRNIEALGTVYENNSIDMNYLFNLVLPTDVVDRDITEAKDYLLAKITDYDIVRKYLKVEKYLQSGPDQLLMEILGQMRDVNFAVDLATALHTHARFWHQSRMINNLNELLELFDAYENLRNVPEYARLMLLMDKIRNSLWDSKIVNVEILCNNPRACLHIGLEIVVLCAALDSETKHNVEELFSSLTKTGSIYVEECKMPVTVPTTVEVPEVTGEWQDELRLTTTEEPTTYLNTDIQTTTTELFVDETTGAISTTPNIEIAVNATEQTTVEPMTTADARNVRRRTEDSTTKLTATEMPIETSTDSTTTGMVTESSTISAATEMVSETLPGATTTGIAAEIWSESTTTEVVVGSTTESITTEMAAETSTDSTTTEMAIETATDSTTTEIAVETPTDSTTTEMPTETLTESITTTEMPTETSTESITTEMPTETSTESTTTEMPTETPTELTTTAITTETLTKSTTTEMATETSTESTTTEMAIESSTDSTTTEIVTESPTNSTNEMATETSTESTTTEMLTEISTESPTTEVATESSTESATTETATESSTDSTTTEMAAESSTDLTTTEMAAESSTNSTTTEMAIEIPTESPITEMVTETSTDSTTTEIATDTPTELTTTEIATETSTESTSTEIVTGTSTESTTTEMATEIPTESPTTEMVTETSTDSTTTEIATDTPTELTTIEIGTETSTESTTTEMVTGTSTESTKTEIVEQSSLESSTESTVETDMAASSESTTTKNTPMTVTTLESITSTETPEIPSSSELPTESTTTFTTQESTTNGETTTVSAPTEGYEKKSITGLEPKAETYHDECGEDCSESTESVTTLPSTEQNTNQTSLPPTIPDVGTTGSPFSVTTSQTGFEDSVTSSTEGEVSTNSSELKRTVMEKHIRMAADPLPSGSLVKDCSGDNCTTKINKCDTNGNCSDSECVGDACTESPPTSTTTSANDPQIVESTCTGDDCLRNDENRTLTTTVKPKSRCDNKDPHHQRKLHRLRKIRLINALHATTPVPQNSASDSSADNDFFEASQSKSLKTTAVEQQMLHEGVQLNRPRNYAPYKLLPWKTSSKKSIRGKKMKKFDNGRKRDNWRNVNVNKNVNVNRNTRRFLTSNSPDDSITSPPSSKWVDQFNHHRQKVAKQNTENYDESKRPIAASDRWNYAAQQKKAEDRIERVRRNRSIIKVPKQTNRRYRAL